MVGASDAWRRGAFGGNVFVPAPGSAGTERTSTAADPRDRGSSAWVSFASVRGAVLPHGTAFDPARAVAAGFTAARFLHRALGASAHGAARIQSSFPLVRWAIDGRAGLGCDDLLEEPGPVARW